MDKNQIAEIIRKRLKLENQEWEIIEQNPKFQRLLKTLLRHQDIG